MPVERTRNTDASKHRRASEIDYQHQRLDGSLPFRRIMLALQQLRDEGGGVVQRDQLAAVCQRDRIVEASRLPLVSQQRGAVMTPRSVNCIASRPPIRSPNYRTAAVLCAAARLQ